MSDSNEHISKEKTNTKTSLAEDINSKLEKYRMDSLNELEKKADEFSQKANNNKQNTNSNKNDISKDDDSYLSQSNLIKTYQELENTKLELK